MKYATLRYEGGKHPVARKLEANTAGIGFDVVALVGRGAAARFSRNDARACRQFVTAVREYLPLLLKGFYTSPMPFGSFIGLLVPRKQRQGQCLSSALLASALAVVNDLFESPELKIHLLRHVDGGRVREA